MQPWMEEVLKHKDAGKLTREQQTLLFLGDILEKKGSDKFMKKVLTGDKSAMRDAYRILHHTDTSDKATETRANKYFK